MYKARKLQQKVFQIIKENWPVHPSGVCRILKIEDSVANISKIKYHFDVLRKKGLVRTKKIDRALVAWPAEIEKIRLVHDLLKEEEKEEQREV